MNDGGEKVCDVEKMYEMGTNRVEIGRYMEWKSVAAINTSLFVMCRWLGQMSSMWRVSFLFNGDGRTYLPGYLREW